MEATSQQRKVNSISVYWYLLHTPHYHERGCMRQSNKRSMKLQHSTQSTNLKILIIQKHVCCLFPTLYKTIFGLAPALVSDIFVCGPTPCTLDNPNFYNKSSISLLFIYIMTFLASKLFLHKNYSALMSSSLLTTRIKLKGCSMFLKLKSNSQRKVKP